MSNKHPDSKSMIWKTMVAKYQKSDKIKSIWQLSNSFIFFIILLYLMHLSLNVSYLLTIILALPAAGFIMRLFIIQHDCGHGSFFNSKKANDIAGTFLSILTLTPYHYWKKKHALHHASVGNLEQRGVGDIYTMTVDEYLRKSSWGKFKYRLYRNPIILFIFYPTILFLIIYRIPFSNSKFERPIRKSVYFTNLVIVMLAAGIIWLIGLKAFFLIQLPIYIISSTAGIWIFYIQHQFEDTYWNTGDEWDYTQAAMQGSSYYKLPKVLQWFTGNIGFHHIHHLSPKIPNYELEKCHKENPQFQKAVVLTLRTSFRSLLLNLWDENQKKLISFYQLKRNRRTANFA